MRTNVFCPLCGINLREESQVDQTSSPLTSVLPWYAEVRGVYLSDPLSTVSTISLTGVGIVQRRNRLHAPLEKNSSYLGKSLAGLEEWRICDASPGPWCFGFHDSCWRLLLCRISIGQSTELDEETEIAIAGCLFNQLNCTPCIKGSIFQFGHDYDGVIKMHKPSGPLVLDFNSYFFADPGKVAHVEALSSALSTFTNNSGQRKHTRSNHTSSTVRTPSSYAVSRGREVCFSLQHGKNDQFCTGLGRTTSFLDGGLSAELMHEIISYLPFKQVLRLRLVCRNIALMFSRIHLPQSYWRSRFCLGQEADFLFPAFLNSRLPRDRDWMAVFFGTVHSLRDRDRSMLNRKRIRGLLEPIAVLWDCATSFRTGPYGSAVSPESDEARPDEERLFRFVDDPAPKTDSLSLRIVAGFSGQMQACTQGPLTEGCRAFHYRTQPLSRFPDGISCQIVISTTQFGTRRFISGINIFPGTKYNAGHGLGYNIPAAEEQISSASDLKTISVAFRPEGLVGIKFTFQDSSSTDWFGNTEYAGTAFGSFVIPQDSPLSYLIAGFDAYKVVSLGLGIPKIDGIADAQDIHSLMWSPSIPSEPKLNITRIRPATPSWNFEPLMNIDFGAPKDSSPRALTRLTCYMNSPPDPLIGIETFFSDGRSTLFGSKTGCEITFFVNGKAGERINKVGIIEAQTSMYDSTIILLGLQVSTNHGRVASFFPLQLKLDEQVKMLSAPPPGYCITGLVAIERDIWGGSTGLKHPYQGRFGGIAGIGVQSQPCEDVLTPPVAGHAQNIPNHHVPDEQLRYDKESSRLIDCDRWDNYQTYVSLTNVRRITASAGAPERGRSSGVVSGLKFEYFDDQAPDVLGQWIHEIDGALELSMDENLQSLMVTLKPIGFSTSMPTQEICQIVAIHIETSQSRSMTFRVSHDESEPPKTSIYQSQCDFGETMVAMSWIFNIHADWLRSITLRSNTNHQMIMVPELTPPWDQTQKLYLTTRNSAESPTSETVIAVEACMQNEVIVGISFLYPSGKVSKIGNCDGITAKICIPEGSRVVGFSTERKDEELKAIEFEVEPTSKKIRLCVESLKNTETAAYPDINWRDVWCKDEASAEKQQRRVQGRDFNRPFGSNLVGLYVSSIGFYSFGAIYEPEAI